MPSNCSCFLSSADFQNQLLQKNLLETLSVSKRLDPDHERHFVGPGLDPNCLQRLSTDDKNCRWRVKSFKISFYQLSQPIINSLVLFIRKYYIYI